ncbi:MAG: hypothetical protein HYU36_10050 [Planctomycetes bacterium]|nr:hypothetical protein [Planctomycetota bacterium]
MSVPTSLVAEKFRMTEEQRYLFDLRGFLILPSVLDASQAGEIKTFLYTLKGNPASLPEHQRNVFSGPCTQLLDHPAIVGILEEVIEGSTPESYGFRCDNGFMAVRKHGEGPAQGPHRGTGATHAYHVKYDRIFAPSVRVVWELNPVRRGDGATMFLVGSHHSPFACPEAFMKKDCPLYEDYECPAGSALLFSEGLLHFGRPWLNRETERAAIFYHYMHYGMRFHRPAPSPETILALTPLQRTLFRDVWILDFPPGKMVANNYYSESNRARDRQSDGPGVGGY